jgi:F420-non-reducing hydrogenase small subunit
VSEQPTPKPKVAFYWCASCGGCEEAVVDLAEQILDVVAAVDIVFWPVALDFKKDDVEALADGEIAASFVNGAIRTSEQEEMAGLLRRKSQLLLAFGSCSHLGGVPGLANLWDRESIFEEVYGRSPALEANGGTVPLERTGVPEGDLQLPAFRDTVRTLDQVVDVDFYVPGCPPTPKVIANALQALLSGELPPKGSVLAGPRALCHECPLRATKPERPVLADVKRVWEIVPDPDTCLLAQGILCLGPVTRGGCEALCIGAHMPCTGCFGPLDRVEDYGAKGLSAVASLLDADDPDEIESLAGKIPDLVGTFYRYSLPASLLRRRATARTNGSSG